MVNRALTIAALALVLVAGCGDSGNSSDDIVDVVVEKICVIPPLLTPTYCYTMTPTGTATPTRTPRPNRR